MKAFYFYEGTTRKGPIDPAQLVLMANSGKITPETIIEDVRSGKRCHAAKVNGLRFPSVSEQVVSVPPPIPEPAFSTEPSPASAIDLTPPTFRPSNIIFFLALVSLVLSLVCFGFYVYERSSLGNLIESNNEKDQKNAVTNAILQEANSLEYSKTRIEELDKRLESYKAISIKIRLCLGGSCIGGLFFILLLILWIFLRTKERAGRQF